MDSVTIRRLDDATRECILMLPEDTWFPVYTLEKKLERPDYDPGGRQVIMGVMKRLEGASRSGDRIWIARPGTRSTVLEMGWF